MAEVRLIDAIALMEVIKQHDYPLATRLGSIDNGMYTTGIQQAVDEAPTIDPESLRPKGRWEDMYGGQFDNPLIVCPVCKEPALEKSVQDLLGNWWARQEPSNYCHNCGAKMEG